MTLSSKWILFRKKAVPDGAPQQQLLFGQACFLAGAQASFQILANASGATQEEAVVIWGSLQREIMDAVGKPKEPLVAVPPEKTIII